MRQKPFDQRNSQFGFIILIYFSKLVVTIKLRSCLNFILFLSREYKFKRENKKSSDAKENFEETRNEINRFHSS